MFVKTLSMRNFKSFPKADIHFEEGFNCLVGPNGSGKSNTIDALQFAFGESRIRALRARKVRDLIFKNAKVGEVEVVLFDAGKNEEHKISRAVRRDGKIKYSFDGKTTKKYVIEDFLAKHALSHHNIVQQGAVQQIVEMKPQDRRTLIDRIANISEYEEKKKEAFSELGHVDERLREAHAILAEREGYMNQLKQDKEDAEKYVLLKKDSDSLQATILSMDAASLEADFSAVLNTLLDSNNKISAINQRISEISASIQQSQQDLQKLGAEIQQRSEGRQLEVQREIDELNNQVKVAQALIQDKQDLLAKIGEKKRVLLLEHQKSADEVKGLSSRIAENQQELDSAKKLLADKQAEYNKIVEDQSKFSQDFYDARKTVESSQEQMTAAKDKLNLLQSEISTLQEKRDLKERELERLKMGQFQDYSSEIKNREDGLAELEKDLKRFEASLDGLFEKEKELNERVQVLDDLILVSREKTVELQARLRHVKQSTESQAIEAVLELGKKDKGIYGTLEQLCKYEAKYTLPIQIALGHRVNYVVVDSVETASKAIALLKKNKLGRVSFIPLDKIRADNPSIEQEDVARRSSLGFLIDFLDFDNKFSRAFKYALGSTVLVTSLESSKPLVGKIRFVSLEGELSEASGLLTGGSAEARASALKDQRELEEWLEKHEKSRSEKESVISSIRQLQDRMRDERKRKAEAELKQKELSLELENCRQQEKLAEQQQGNLRAAVKKLKDEVAGVDKEISSKDDERSEIVRSLSQLNLDLLEAKQKIDVEQEEKFGILIKEKERAISDLKIQLSEYENRIQALVSNRQVYEKQVASFDKDLAEFESEESLASSAVDKSDQLIKQARSQLKEKLAEQKQIAGALKEYFDARDSLEKQVVKFGNEKGKLEFEREKIYGHNQDANVKKAVLEEKLSTVKAELAAFEGVSLIHGKDRAVLKEQHTRTKQELDSLGTVNLKSIELYGQRLQEFEAQKQKVEQLRFEKDAVINLINEIEGKKIATFMETYNFVNENFTRLFSQIFNGHGELFLENPENPFEGGLTMQVQLENKEVKYLELMSGGEKALIALIFIFALQAYTPSSVYILDEADAALDQENSRKLVLLLKELAKKSQFLVISHNQTVYKDADTLVGVAMTNDGSKLVEVKLNE